jgi:TolB-like protein/Flp pilus assembly protein TadD
VAKERFLVEARAAAAVDHPNVCTVHEIGEDEDGQLFIAMAYYPGETLSRRLERGPLPVEEAVEYARQIAGGLAAAHEQGVVHRDIKPGNVIGEPDSGVKVLDFGLAKLADVTLTGGGMMLGTVAYMSPEQLSGEAVDERTDLWALGVLLYEMLTGERPFKGNRDRAVVDAIRHNEPEPPSALREDLPAEVEALVLRLLSKDPENRCTTAKEVEHLLADPAAGLAMAGRQAARGSKRRALQMALGAVALALLVSGIFVLAPGDRNLPAEAPSLAVLPFQNLSGDEEQEYLADGMTDALINELGSIGALKVISRTSAMYYKESQKRLPEIAGELGVGTILEGTVRRAGDRIGVSVQLVDGSSDEPLWANSYDRSFSDIFAIQSDIAQAIAVALDAELSPVEERPFQDRTPDPEAYAYYLQGNDYFRRNSGTDRELAESMYERAVELDPEFAEAWERLVRVRVLIHIGLYDTLKLAAANEALDRLRALGRDLDATHSAEGWYAYNGEFDNERALQEFELLRHRRPGDTDILWALAKIGGTAGRWEESIANSRRVLELDPRNAEAAAWLAGTLQTVRRFEEAEVYMDRALSLAPDVHFFYNQKWALYMFGFGDTTRARQVFEAAEGLVSERERAWQRALAAWFRRDYAAAIEEFAAWPRPDPIKYEFLARIAYSAGEMDVARIYADSLEIIAAPRLEKAIERQNEPQMAIAKYELAMVNVIRGRYEEAVREAEEALRLVPLDFHPQAPGLAFRLVLAYVAAGRHDDAVRLLERLLEVPGAGGGSTVHGLRLNPGELDSLRDHPGFQALLQRSDGD